VTSKSARQPNLHCRHADQDPDRPRSRDAPGELREMVVESLGRGMFMKDKAWERLRANAWPIVEVLSS